MIVALELERIAAHLDQARIRPLTDVLGQVVGIIHIGGEDDRALVLVAIVDD